MAYAKNDELSRDCTETGDVEVTNYVDFSCFPVVLGIILVIVHDSFTFSLEAASIRPVNLNCFASTATAVSSIISLFFHKHNQNHTL